jgi:transposase
MDPARPRGAAGQLRGARVLAAQLYGAGPVTALALTCWLGGAGRFSPDHDYYAAVKDRKGGKRAALSEARKIVRRASHIPGEPGDDAFAPGVTRPG